MFYLPLARMQVFLFKSDTASIFGYGEPKFTSNIDFLVLKYSYNIHLSKTRFLFSQYIKNDQFAAIFTFHTFLRWVQNLPKSKFFCVFLKIFVFFQIIIFFTNYNRLIFSKRRGFPQKKDKKGFLPKRIKKDFKPKKGQSFSKKDLWQLCITKKLTDSVRNTGKL